MLFLTTLPWVVYWATQVRFGTAYVEAWLPDSAPSRQDYREYRERFGSDQFLLVSWRGCSLDDPRLPALADELRELASERPDLQVEAVEDSLRAVSSLASSLRATTEDARKRLEGVAIGRNGTAIIALRLGIGAVSKHSQLVGLVEAQSARLGIPADDLILAGEAYHIHMIDRASRESMQFYVLPSSLLALGSAWYCLRSIRLTVLVFAFAGYGQVLGMALVSLVIGELSAVMVVLPTLMFMLTLSAAIHLANYYRDAVLHLGAGESRARTAGIQAFAVGWRPCAMATCTTVIGFASLFASQLAPVWQFGLLSAVGLSLSTLVLIGCFPAACRLIAGDAETIHVPGRQARGSLTTWGLERLLTLINARPTAISVLGILLLVVSLGGLLRLKSSTEFKDMFGEQSRAVTNLNWVEENVGPLHSLEFQLRFADSGDERLIERLGVLQSVGETLAASPDVEQVYSALTFLPKIPQQSGMRGTIRRSILRGTVLANLDTLSANQILAREDGGETWRLSVRVRQLQSDNFYRIRKELLEICDQRLVLECDPEERPDIVVSGLRTVVETAHQSLLGDLSTSFAAAFLLITPLMMIVTRGFWSGLILMLPNVLPVALVFGGMGWLGVRLDVASILTASVALGIAVDDTLHFLIWYMRSRRRGVCSTTAVAEAMAACGRPMLHTSIICTTAMLPFFFSDFVPTSKFALLMIMILAGAIVGDLILLPALLLSPLGRLLAIARPATNKSSDPSNTTT